MPNVSLASSIMIFQDERASMDQATDMRWADYLQRREFAERAAAKRSRNVAARRIHQQLAESYAARRGSDSRSPHE